MKPKYSVSILAINGLEMTRACIESVLESSDDCKLILTDNASNDGTAAYFDSLRGSRVTVKHNPVNKGFAEPNIEALAQCDTEYFVTLNNDATVPPGWLEMLETELVRHPNAGLAGASGTCCGFVDGATQFLGAPTRQFEYIEDSCMMGRTALLKEVGLFSPFLTMAYGEDVDLSLRLRSMGYTLHLAPFHISHIRAATAQHVPGLRAFQARNHAYLMKRWGAYLKHRRLDLPFVIRRMGARGDCLLVTALIRAIKQGNPRSEIFMETDCPEVFKGNPNVAGTARSWQQNYQWATFINLDEAYENRPETNFMDAYEQAAGIVIPDKLPDLFLTEEENQYAELRIRGEPWVSIHAGPSWESKMWPESRWSFIAETLMGEGWKVTLIGSEGTGNIPCTLDLRGKTTLRQAAAVIGKSNLFIGICSCPLHLAVAMRTPAIGLFGITRGSIVLPEGANCDAIESDPEHPMSGIRHRTTGETFLRVDDNPMLTISAASVLDVVRSKHSVWAL